LAGFLALSNLIDKFNEWVGKSVSWLILAAVIVSAGNAIIRKAFNMSSNSWLELQWYLFGAVFMLAAAYTLKQGEHIRIDIIFGMRSKKTQDRIELFGHLFFLLPFCLLMVWLLVPYTWHAIKSGEVSANAGGLILWPSKAIILAGFVLLTFQAVSEIIKRIAIMSGHIDDPNPHGSSHAPLDMNPEVEKNHA
jgi:TRAP-type mannitol/chloroaromatic compound transport system permease small subunit